MSTDSLSGDDPTLLALTNFSNILVFGLILVAKNHSGLIHAILA
jgi:hypothetical protein